MSPLRSRSPTAPSDHENVLDTPMEGSNILKGTPPRSMYIDDQAEEDTDSESELTIRNNQEGTDMEKWMKAKATMTTRTRWRREWRLSRRGETLAGGPSNSKLASELFPQDEDSDPETEQYLPPPSSSTTVATVIHARIRRYFDDQAEDSDEDADEEREEEEQEMEEDRDFVEDTAVDEDFVHRLPSNRDDAHEVKKWVAHFQNEDKIVHYKRDVAREAAGEVGAPLAEQKQMLSPCELVLYNKAKHLRTDMQVAQFECALHREMLADVDVKLHTWVRAPIQFDCRVGFVLTVTDLVVIQDGEAKIRLEPHGMSQRWFPKVESTFAEIMLFADSRLELLSRIVLTKPSPPLDAGDRVVVMTGDRKGSTGRIKGVADIRIAGKWVAMAQVLPPSPDPYPKGKGPLKPPKKPRPFEVGLAQLKCHTLDLYYNFRIHDRVRVVSGALYVGAIGRVEKVEGHFLTLAVPKDCEVVGATWSSLTSDSTKLFIISIVHITRQWAIGDSVRVMRGQYEGQVGVILGLHSSGYLALLEANVGYSRYQDVPHLRKVRCSDVDFEHELWTTMATNCLPSASWSESNSDIDLTPRMSQHGFEGIEVIVAKSNDFIAQSKEAKNHEHGEGHIDIPHKGFIGMIIGDFDSRERSDRLKNGVEPDHKRHTGKLLKPVDSTCLRNPDVAGIMVTIRGSQSFETVQVPIENDDGVLGRGSLFFRPTFCSGADRLNHPQIHALSPIEAPSAATPKWHHLPDLQLPSLRMRRYGVHTHRWKPELIRRRLDVQILGIATLANSTVSKVQRTLEGNCGWVLLSEPVTTKTRKVDVCSKSLSVWSSLAPTEIQTGLVRGIRPHLAIVDLGANVARTRTMELKGAWPHRGLGLPPRLDPHMPPTRPSRRTMKANIEEAKNAAAADPTNRSKALEYQYLAADYAERFEFGVYEADAAVNRYIATRTRREFVMDQLRHVAVHAVPSILGDLSRSTTTLQPHSIETSVALTRPDDILATKRKLCRIYKGLMLLETEEQAELVA
ncbi:hypothetical protein B0H14DRAFT_2645623 [Mycena olivaceomarginata]|nr:hypothetical protein B0H14DRAFT_2645623 [Mycena olivaceomarginata]